MAWLTNWTYRKEITVTNASADYQTKILIGKTSDAVGEDVDCNGHVADDFDDLRFTAADETTLLDYWIEKIVDSGGTKLATVWVQNNATPDTTLYMYYGGTETAVSDGDATFIFFDDFPGNSVNTDKWTVSGSPTVSGGILTMNAVGGTIVLTRKVEQAYGEMRMKAAITQSQYYTYFYWGKWDGSYWQRNDWCRSTYLAAYSWKDGSYTGGDVSGAFSVGTTYIWQLDWAANYAQFVRSGTVDRTHTTNVPTLAGPINFVVYKSGSLYDIATVDWVFIRKWASTEPSFAWGSEETSGTNMKINIGDSWKDVTKIQVNVGDNWKEVTSAKINISETWE